MANKNGIDPVSIRAIYPKKWTVANKHGISFTVVITNKHAVFYRTPKFQVLAPSGLHTALVGEYVHRNMIALYGSTSILGP